MDEKRTDNLQNELPNDVEQTPKMENVESAPKKLSVFHLVFKIIIGIVYLLATGYMAYLLGVMLTEKGWAALGFVIMLIYVVFAYLFNIIMSIIGIVKSKKDYKNGKTDKPVDKFYVVSIIVNVVTYLGYWLVLFMNSLSN